jgi:hypothetical protein
LSLVTDLLKRGDVTEMLEACWMLQNFSA